MVGGWVWGLVFRVSAKSVVFSTRNPAISGQQPAGKNAQESNLNLVVTPKQKNNTEKKDLHCRKAQ